MSFTIRKIEEINHSDDSWDKLCVSVYQNKEFLNHLEKYNPCHQRYYLLYENNMLCSGAIVYSLKVNVFTYSKLNCKINFSLIGIPASVDASGIIGDEKYYSSLVEYIIKNERGIILCLNYDNIIGIDNIVQMQTLPALIFENNFSSWEHYCKSLKHNYRRRIFQAQNKFCEVNKVSCSCSHFNDEHYEQYISIMSRTKTKLEILSKEFFMHLGSNYTLHSFYKDDILLTWHITIKNEGSYYFLFGGINYELRDKYDSYYNNLISIVKEGIELGCDRISMGQTAEISKNRLGARLVTQRMFIYHSNKLVNYIFVVFRNVLTYKTKTIHAHIFKSN